MLFFKFGIHSADGYAFHLTFTEGTDKKFVFGLSYHSLAWHSVTASFSLAFSTGPLLTLLSIFGWQCLCRSIFSHSQAQDLHDTPLFNPILTQWPWGCVLLFSRHAAQDAIMTRKYCSKNLWLVTSALMGIACLGLNYVASKMQSRQKNLQISLFKKKLLIQLFVQSSSADTCIMTIFAYSRMLPWWYSTLVSKFDRTRPVSYALVWSLFYI